MVFKSVKVIALAVSNLERAKTFYGSTLGLVPETAHGMDGAYMVGDSIILLKPIGEWYGRPSPDLNARVTLEVADAAETEKELRQKGVTVSDAVGTFEGHPLGAFLDSEGNKLWFCSS